MGERIYIDRDWNYKDSFSEEYKGTLMQDAAFVSLPHSVSETPLHYFDENIYQKVSCYQRVIFGKEEWAGKDVFITFEGAAHEAEVYLNGTFLGVHRCGYTAFTFLLKDLKCGEDNLITVRLDSREELNQPPFGFVIDYMTYGGLYRDVYLEVKDPVHMDDVFLRPQLSVPAETGSLTKKELSELRMPGKLSTVITLSKEAKKIAQERRLFVRQYLDGRMISNQPLREDGRTSTLAGDINLWDIHSPRLYKVRTEILVDDEVRDFDEKEAGFRDIAFKKDGFYLNGRYLKLRGVNRHQSYPYVGYAMPESMQRQDAVILKNELGLNAVRTSHYPQSQYFINECDRIGLLVFTEIPGWQHIGDDEWKDIAVNNVREMVVQYRNHPSIILWGVRINESRDDDDFYRRTNMMAHDLDPTRLTGGVRCNKKMSFLEDVYTYNDFVHSGSNQGCEKKDDVTPDPERPYLISEYNGHMFPTKPYDKEEEVLEHVLRHARVLDSVNHESDIAGSFAWCMFDYNTHKDFGSGDRICYHGIMDMFRNPKAAAYVYAAQSKISPVLYVTSSMDIGEHPASVRGNIYIITNAESVKMYKNGRFIKEYFPEDTPFKNMKRGPIPINDLIGDEMMEKEGFSKKQNELVKICLNETAFHGYKVTPKIARAAAKLMAFYHMSPDDARRLYEKYIGDWGGESKEYRFEAMIGGKVVKTVTKSTMRKVVLEAETSSKELHDNITYDVAEIFVRAVDENKNVLYFMNDPYSVEIDGPAKLIGPKIPAFSGGQSGLYIRSVGKEGKVTVKLHFDGADDIEVELNVVKGETKND